MWPDEVRPYYGSFIASQANSLVEQGVHVDVGYIRGYTGLRAYAEAAATIPRTARRENYDLVHVHYGHTAVASLGMFNRPLVTSFCGEDLLGAPRESGITRKSRIEVAVFRQAAHAATVTITKSQEMAEILPNAVRARNFVLPNGVDLSRFAPGDRAHARAELGWAPDGKVLLFLGNPEDPRKNVQLARAAAERVEAQISDARLHIAWGIPPGDVATVMNAADCLVFASKSEGSPNAVKEAMACTLPVVATAANVDNCYVRDPDPQLFADAIVGALAKGRAPAARTAVEELGTSAVANRLLDIYDTADRLHRS
jgi:glycosyltransferase involved in cell wall biosynthesis